MSSKSYMNLQYFDNRSMKISPGEGNIIYKAVKPHNIEDLLKPKIMLITRHRPHSLTV